MGNLNHKIQHTFYYLVSTNNPNIMHNSILQLFILILFISILTSSCNSFNKRKAVGVWAWEIKSESDNRFSDQVQRDTVKFTMDGIFRPADPNTPISAAQVRWDARDEHLFLEIPDVRLPDENSPDITARLDSFRVIPSNRFDRFYIKYELGFSSLRISGTKVYRNLWGI